MHVRFSKPVYMAQDEETAKLVQSYWKLVEEGMEEVIGRVECELDGRFSYIRTQASRTIPYFQAPNGQPPYQ